MLTLYSNQGSGNCYKVRLLLHQLGYEFETREMDVVAGACQSDEFKAINPAGQVPALVLDEGMVLCQSNAILLHFADETQYMAMDYFDKSLTYQWLFWEQYSHEPALAVARYSMHYLGQSEAEDPRLPMLWQKGYQALDVMEKHLCDQDFFVGNRYSIVDIALFAYSHVADQGGFDLAAYPKVSAWIDRVKSQPRWKSMDEI
ncbi:Glutathione S-transferase, N-terminal domain protein [Candidatus Terasakiella magnetica]|uniref:Glutathione S-transferase, N-terminal domain protein n=1 Tax=Candidatus Terasakiella magnetica TaxID=1867952 RepID=A0A1C3RG79_9PROT|nr:glutathione S-transferase family protein [Candidatus Terasakiella magnetica]SCA56265.1 Glutathione S-transferase, N-terminal domain protein [Candidatus Terasakiella magnetica]